MIRSRFVMFSASSLWIALILVVSVFRGGGAVPLEPRLEASTLNPVEQATALADLGDYEGARRFYQEALSAVPEDASLWYALGGGLSGDAVAGRGNAPPPVAHQRGLPRPAGGVHGDRRGGGGQCDPEGK